MGYDTLGRPVSWTYEDGHQEQVKRDAQGAIVWQKSVSAGAATSHVFDQEVDAFGRVLSTRSASGGGVEIVSTYDTAGRVLTREDRWRGWRVLRVRGRAGAADAALRTCVGAGSR